MSLVQPTRSGTNNANGVGVKRPYQLMINSAAHNTAGDEAGQAKNIKLDKDAVLLEDLIEENLVRFVLTTYFGYEIRKFIELFMAPSIDKIH